MSYVNPSSMMALAVCFLNLCTILVVLRIMGRKMQKLGIGIDDILMIIAWFFTAFMCILMITAVAYQRWGMPLPPRRLPNGKISPLHGHSPELAESEKFFFIQEAIFPLQLMFAKLSILFFYKRTLCPGRSPMYWATLVVAAITTLWGIIMFFLYTFQCGTRFSLAWDGPLLEEFQVCLPSILEVAMGSTDVFLDLVIFILPIHRIWTLKMPIGKKILVAAVFAFGSITVAASAVRLAIYTSELTGIQSYLIMPDENMMTSIEMYWGMFEAGFAVTTACLPSVQYLITAAALSLGERLESYGRSLYSGKASFSNGNGSASNGSGEFHPKGVERATPDYSYVV